MKVSDRGLAFIADHEGVVTRAYRDSVGVWTIGVGHTASAGPPKPVAGMKITRTEAMDLFARDIAKFEKRVAKALGNVPQHVFDGATSFDFNTGAIDSASWVNSYRMGKLGQARINFMKWNKPREIIGRRGDEADLIFEADYGRHSDPIDAPSVSKDKEAIKLYQSQLATLGFYLSAVDGIAGPKTIAAVMAYQKKHPDLVADGIVGPATRASLARDVAALKGTSVTVPPSRPPVIAPAEPATHDQPVFTPVWPRRPVDPAWTGTHTFNPGDGLGEPEPRTPPPGGVSTPVKVGGGIAIIAVIAGFIAKLFGAF